MIDLEKGFNINLLGKEFSKKLFEAYLLAVKRIAEENEELKNKLKATNKGLAKVRLKRLKWKNRYYKERYKNKKAIEYLEKFVPVDTDTIILSEKQRDFVIELLQRNITDKD